MLRSKLGLNVYSIEILVELDQELIQRLLGTIRQNKLNHQFLVLCFEKASFYLKSSLPLLAWN